MTVVPVVVVIEVVIGVEVLVVSYSVEAHPAFRITRPGGFPRPPAARALCSYTRVLSRHPLAITPEPRANHQSLEGGSAAVPFEKEQA